MGSLVRWRPGRPCVAFWCLLGACLALAPFQAPPARAQGDIDTQQKANERIQELAKSTHTPPPHDYVIGRGDVMSVEVFEVPELSRDVRVSQTGTIGLPLLPVRLFVTGLTETQAQQKIAEVLEANGLVSHPQVMVFVKEKRSKPIAVVGAVARPMVVQADRPISLIEVLADAGGIASDAGDVVLVTRGGVGDTAPSTDPPEIAPGDAIPAGDPASAAASSVREPSRAMHAGDPGSKPAEAPKTAEQNASAGAPPPVANPAPPANIISVNLSELLERGETQNNITLQAGDVITIPHAGIVYALGAVNRPGGFVAKDDRAQLSTLKILALAGGTTRYAKRSGAVIIRKDNEGHQHEIPVDLKKIVRRETEDVKLLPSDILYVPDSYGKAALIRAGEIMLGVGTSLAIYRIGTQ